MEPVRRVRFVTTFAVERQKYESEHVGRRQQRGENPDRPEDRVSVREGFKEDLVLAEETRESGDAGNRERADQECPIRDRQASFQAAHVPDVLLAMQRMDHRTGAEEQACLEKRVRVEMEDTGAKCTDAHREEHVTE